MIWLLQLLGLPGRPYQWECPRCKRTFATVHVSMTRRRNRLPSLTSLRGDIICDHCGFEDSEAAYTRRHRGWIPS